MHKQVAPRMLIIDEIQHLLSCNAREQRAALNAIKYLANTLRMSIVAAGTHEAVHVMRYDPQIVSRFEQMELPIWGSLRSSGASWRAICGRCRFGVPRIQLIEGSSPTCSN